MKFIAKPYATGLPCKLKIFSINEKPARLEDFGDMVDVGFETAPEHECGDMQFVPKMSTPKILDKYSISEHEYHEIVAHLEEILSVGSCGWCV